MKAYQQKGVATEEIQATFMDTFVLKHELMRVEDVSMTFEIMALLGFKSTEIFRKKVLKVTSRLIGNFNARQIARMYVNWRDELNWLNPGVKQRILKHSKFLIESQRMKPKFGADIRTALRSRDFFEKESREHRERTEKAKAIAEQVEQERGTDRVGLASKEWFELMDKERVDMKKVSEGEILNMVEKLLEKSRYFL